MKPLYEPDVQTRTFGLARGERRLQRRSSGPWHLVVGGVGFQNSWTDSGGTLTTTRFRWNLSGGLDLVINVTGGVDGTVVFTLPAGYTPADFGLGDIVLPLTDDTGLYKKCLVAAGGNVTVG